MFQRGSKFYNKISSGGSIFFEKLVPGGTNFGGSMTEHVILTTIIYHVVQGSNNGNMNTLGSNGTAIRR